MLSPSRNSNGNKQALFSSLKINRLLFLILTAALLATCGEMEKSEISELMDARDQAISQRSISNYSRLIYRNYHDQGRGKVDVVAQMISLFDKFDRAEMRSHDRQIQQLDNNLARCDQSYTLKVLADGEWRQIVQREQLTLSKDSDGWKISGGL